jgi:transcriptional regulator
MGRATGAAAVPPRAREGLRVRVREAAFSASGGSLGSRDPVLLVSVSALPPRISALATYYPGRVYLPRHFSLADLEQIHAFVDAAQAADLVTFDGVQPVATRLPVIWDRAAEPGGEADLGRLLGHLALANDQWQTASPDPRGLAIVSGPQAYISPSWYESKARHGRVVPTWNYEAVHLTGPVTFHHDPEWLREFVTRLTRRHEDGRQRPWAVTDAPPDYVNGQLRAIVGVELIITTVEAKQKLSQNRSAADQAGTVAGLRGEPGPGPAAIAEAMAANLGGSG